VFLSGAGALGVEIAKNIVLAGCKSFVLHDDKPISKRDLSGQFFLNGEDKQPTRGGACLNRLQSLNFYVKVTAIGTAPVPKDPAMYEQEPWNFHQKDVIVLTESDYETIVAVNDYCHKKGIKFMACDAHGVYGRIFNDFGDQFEVYDTNGEALQDCLIQDISCDEKGLV